MPPINVSSPNDRYPEIYRCDLGDSPVLLPNDGSLEIRTWIGWLTSSETLRMTSIDGWAAVILWEGAADVVHDTEPRPIESCNSGLAHIGWLPLVPGDEVRALGTAATVIVVSLAKPEGAPQFDGNVSEGITQQLDSDHQNEPLLPLLRTIRTKPRQLSFQVKWPRGGVAITTSGAPGVGPDDLPRADQGDLIFRGLPKDTSIFWTPGTDDDALAIVIDFMVESDRDPVAEPAPETGGGEGGCGWRCKGG